MLSRQADTSEGQTVNGAGAISANRFPVRFLEGFKGEELWVITGNLVGWESRKCGLENIWIIIRINILQ